MKYLILPFLTLLISSCKKDETPTPTQTSSNQLNTFIGYLSTYDYTNPKSNQNYGIQVTVLGNNNEVVTTSTTDSTGKFQISNLPVGTYDFQYTKPDWAKYTTLSVNHSFGPKPTIFTFENGNPYNNLTYPLIRTIYSDIVDLKLDSIEQMWANNKRYHFTLIVNPDSRDLLENASFGVMSTNFLGDGVNSFFSFPDSIRFIPPNKIYIRSYSSEKWEQNEPKSVFTSISASEDYIQDLFLIKPTQYSMNFKSEGSIKVKTFNITKP
jgi:hypothetical protein